ncbi:hypothetical protein PR202_gb25373 [Eleusine coracana subsp. coracana]|uniref:Reverse transcriptase zinc-binding domain-containing protein n=1 Tax=Eleusine coracana subsp. coracana TaxID=191504 RepID=A0AAV5FQ01_ELECO|nr:hypothetical protein PR202_gb25329 [Eleusine coracana subsp. coracana]GJN36510.1 hypothetical protein PR202_gb25373 [Eleusine coracana subsp. coracana]
MKPCFWGRCILSLIRESGRVGRLPKCRFFLWLVAHDRCWTADRLAHRGLEHPEKCPLCDQEDETIDHILVSCVFARQFWFSLLRQVGLQQLSPLPDNKCFMEWWKMASEAAGGLTSRGLNTLIILGAWILWNHRNRCVFDGVSPSLAAALVQAGEERYLWELAGAKGFILFDSPAP